MDDNEAILRRAEQLATELGLTHEREEMPADEEGQTIVGVRVYHGSHGLLVLPAGAMAIILYLIGIPEELTTAIAALSNEDQERLVLTLQGELWQGRCGYAFDLEDDGSGTDLLRGIRLEQKVDVRQSHPAALQRMGDAMQELVNLGLRTEAMLGAAMGWRGSGGESASSAGGDPMFG